MQAEPNAPQRKYVLTKIEPGDYLLPSNDGHTMWRLRRYIDGPSCGLEIPRDRTFWGVWKWGGDIVGGKYVDVEDWDRWHMHDSSFDTRAEAIRAALTWTDR